MKSAEIQSQINELDTAIAQGASDAQLNIWEMKKVDLIKELEATLTEEAQQQAHEGRVQDATTEIATYFDTLYVGGQTMRELCADEEAYQILRLSVSQAFIDQATKNSEILSRVQSEYQTASKDAQDSINLLEEQSRVVLAENNQLKIDLADITNKFKAATDQLAEAPTNETTQALENEIKDLKAQLELKAKAEAPKGDTKSQIDAFVQARENNKPKITNLRLADPSGLNTKEYLANDALTGEEMKIHSNYIRSYKEVTAEEAAQYRAEVEQKKAEIEAQNTVIPTLESVIEPVTEVEAPAEEKPFPEEAGHELGQGLSVDGEHVGNETPEKTQESEVVTLESLKAELESLKTAHDTTVVRVGNIERHANIQAVA